MVRKVVMVHVDDCPATRRKDDRRTPGEDRTPGRGIDQAFYEGSGTREEEAASRSSGDDSTQKGTETGKYQASAGISGEISLKDWPDSG